MNMFTEGVEMAMKEKKSLKEKHKELKQQEIALINLIQSGTLSQEAYLQSITDQNTYDKDLLAYFLQEKDSQKADLVKMKIEF